MSNNIEFIAEQFKDHIVSEHEQHGSDIELLVWQKPNTFIYKVTYLCHKNVLFISGDIGEAVFKWSYPIGLKAISECNIDYFMEKCEASEGGRYWREWDYSVALKCIVDHFRNSDKKGRANLFHEFRNSFGFTCLNSREEWVNLGDNREEFFGRDAWEWIYGIGDVYPLRAQAWLTGLKMAFEQIGINNASQSKVQ